ncbi:MAG UNVERIFIED_CONTAM: hypothetical protein LVT10_03710 [Anaerolineae bacterium]
MKCLHVSAPTTLQPAHELHFPQRATAYLHEHPLAGKMFNSYNWVATSHGSCPIIPFSLMDAPIYTG